jgi:hypothetical protein
MKGLVSAILVCILVGAGSANASEPIEKQDFEGRTFPTGWATAAEYGVFIDLDFTGYNSYEGEETASIRVEEEGRFGKIQRRPDFPISGENFYLQAAMYVWTCLPDDAPLGDCVNYKQYIYVTVNVNGAPITIAYYPVASINPGKDINIAVADNRKTWVNIGERDIFQDLVNNGITPKGHLEIVEYGAYAWKDHNGAGYEMLFDDFKLSGASAPQTTPPPSAPTSGGGGGAPATTPPPVRYQKYTPPVGEHGSFIIHSNPEGAAVFFDDNYAGKTPLYSVRAAPGYHTIRFEKEGYEDHITQREIIDGESRQVSVLLEIEEIILTTISVTSNPSGATVYLDGDEKGVTPLIITDVSLEEHVVQLSKKGYSDYVTTLDASLARTYTITADLTSEMLDITNDEVSIQLYSVADVITTDGNSEIILSTVSYIHNTEDMNIQTILKIPSGLAVSSAAFAHAGGGQYTASSTVRPGEMRQISASILPTNLGEYEIGGELIYYFGDDKSSGDIRRINIPLTVAENEDNDEELIEVEGKAKAACGPTIISILSVIPFIILRRLIK